MSFQLSKKELYDLYNLLSCSLIDHEDDPDREDSEDIPIIISITEGILDKIRVSYEGLQDEDKTDLILYNEEARTIVNCLISDIIEHESKIGSEEDPTSFHAERMYYMRDLKERLQKHFNEELISTIV